MENWPPENYAGYPMWKLLIIEDDEDDFIIVREMLKEAKSREIDCHWAATYEAGQMELAGEPYDAVLVDYDLGAHKGIELIRAAVDLGYPAPLILYTGRGGYDVDLEAMQAGATLYITKDEANPLLLERIIRYAIDIKQKEASLRASEAHLRASEAQLRASEAVLRKNSEALRQNEKRIAAEKEWFQTTLASIGDAVIACDLQGDVTYLNPVAEELTGWTNGEAAGQPLAQVFKIINEQTRLPAANPVEKVLKNGIVVGLANHTALITRDGRLIPVEDSAAPIRDADGKIVGVVMVFHDVTEWRRAVEQVQDAILAVDDQLRATSWNKMAEALFGWTAAEIIGKNLPEFFQSNFSAAARAEVITQLMQAGHWAGEVEYHRKDGSTFIAMVRAARLTGAQQEPLGFVSSIRDITEQKQAESALWESEQRFRLALRNAPVSVAAQDRDLRYVWAYNQRSIRPDQIIGHYDHDIFTAEEAAFMTAIKRRVLEDGVERREQMWLDRPIGRLYLDVRWEPIRATDGSIVGVVSATVDLTPIKLTEDALRESEEKFSLVFQKAAYAAALSQLPNGTLVDVNEAWEKLFGFTRQEAIGKTSYELNINPDQAARARMFSLLKEQGFLRDEEMTLFTKSGEQRILLVCVDLLTINGEEYILNTTQDITERKRAERAIVESESRLREFLENTHDSYFSLDRQWRITYANRNFCKAFGVDPQELIGRNFWEQFPHYLGIDVEHNYRKVMAEGTALNFRRQGVYTPGLYDISLVPTHEGLASFSIDRTQELLRQQQLEAERARLDEMVLTLRATTEALLRSEDKFARVFRSSPVAISISTAAEGRYIEVNESLTSLFGFSREEMIGQTSIALGILPDLHARQALGRQFRVGGGLRDYELRLQTKLGEYRDVLLSAEPMLVDGQECTLSLMVDITERKQTQEKMVGLLERLNIATRAGRMGIWDWDIVQNHVIWDDQMYILYGVNRVEFAGAYEAWLEGLHPDDQAASDADSKLALSGDKDYDTEFRVVWSDGSIHWIKALGQVFRDADGRPVRMIGVNYDITDIKLSQTQLEESNQLLERRVEERTLELTRSNGDLLRAIRAKDEFLSTMSHELRTPLNGILNLSESLQEGTYGALAMSQQAVLNTVRESGEHLLQLINDILDFTKVESGRMDLNLDQLLVKDLVDASLRLITPQALKKHIRISVTFDANLTTIVADSRRMKQMLVNLLSNAVKFTPDGGLVGLEIEYKTASEALCFTVWDTGIGIPQDKISLLFQPFRQIDSRLARQYAGTGLGLALVRRLAQLHGGSVGVQSEEGKGSRFWFSIPVSQIVKSDEALNLAMDGARPTGAPDQQATRVLETRQAQQTPGTKALDEKGALIVIAEDNIINLDSYMDFLKSKGFRIIPALTGYEAIARIEENHPDLVLMDMQMPVMDGLEAIRRLRENPEFATLPIIAVTALAMPGDRERCLAAGANVYLAKPVGLTQLLREMNELLSEKRK